MKHILMRVALLCFLITCANFLIGAQQQSDPPLTNTAVVKLVRAGFKDKTVIAIIRSRPAHFDLSPDHLIELKRNGVSENVILVMLASEDSDFAASDDWDNIPLLGETSQSKKGATTSEGETDIFGMNGGSNSRTRQRGAGSASGGDTQTTGSATVRIMRPPLEQGGLLKLEKTPTLTNNSIIELVEAGFSEGTIIRRIEQSPADFDLTPPKLTELHRRRVSDKIIAAMSVAMSDDPPPMNKRAGNVP